MRNELNKVIDDIEEMTNKTMSNFNCELQDCFPLFGKRRIKVDGVEYMMSIEIDINKIKGATE